MALETAGVECFVDIYPFEGGPLKFSGGDILACTTNKSIKKDTGDFKLILAPEAIGQNLSWGQILTPMSLAVIGMRRGDRSQVVFVGVITEIDEEQLWGQSAAGGTTVTRAIAIAGLDLAYFFTMTDYYTLWVLSVTGNLTTGQGLAAGLLIGEPGDVGKKWYEQVMANQGVFKDTYVPYKKSPIKFSDIFATEFDNYDFSVPYGDYFMTSSGTWLNRFRTIFPFPFYEFFVTTAFNDAFPGAKGGTEFVTDGLGSNVSSKVAIVARVNPVPQLVSSVKNGIPSFDSIDTTRWQALNMSDMGNYGFIESGVSFSENELYNFYVVNPLWFTGQTGEDNANIKQPLFNYASVIDQASINRYGYRPLMQPILWFSDMTGSYAQKSGGTGTASDSSSVQKLMATVLGRLCGFYEATPLMLKGQVTTWLRPDIEIGTRFQYKPFRDEKMWEFYITGVTHNFIFGGESKTKLMLERGLPQEIYNDNSASGILFNIHIGNAQRVGGEYKSGLPAGSAAPLKALSRDQFGQLMANMLKLYTTPQATTPSP